MRLPASEKLEIIGLVEQSHLPARRTLQMLVQDDFDLICLASCKHLSGVTRWIGAPKWGIRSRTPL